MKAQLERKKKDIKPITGMFELLQEEGLTTKKEGGSSSAALGHLLRRHTSASPLNPEANCALARQGRIHTLSTTPLRTA